MAAFALALTLAGCAGGPHPVETVPTTASDQTDADRKARVRLELASAYFSRGQNETALDEVKQALVASPNSADAYNLRGLILAAMGDAGLAEESFRRALQINPRDADTLHNFGWFLCQQRRYDAAQAQFDQALAQPQYRETQRTLLAQGVCQARNSQLGEAERTLQRAYEIDPGNPSAALNLAEVLFRKGEYDRARFYVGRVNANSAQSNAQSLWLAVRIEHRSGNRAAEATLANELRNRFPQAPETLSLEGGRFND